mmetsp:Transcript_9456/g.8327  ORF Transcript_9456/g.8327 Transcript_9456/m.8327 type:complete len:254 (-) Transcript_9456:322-1083(-)
MNIERRILENVRKRDRLFKTITTVVKLQSYVRGFLARRYAKYHKNNMKKSSSIIAKHWLINKHKFQRNIDYESSEPNSSRISDSIFSIPKIKTEKEKALEKINDMAEYFKTLKKEKFPEPPRVIKKEIIIQPIEQKEIDTKLKEQQMDKLNQLFDQFQEEKAIEKEIIKEQEKRPKLPRVISDKEIYNSFLKVDDNFDFKIDQNALKKVIECRTEMHPIEGNYNLAQLDIKPFPHKPKIKPMNVKEMEDQLNK